MRPSPHRFGFTANPSQPGIFVSSMKLMVMDQIRNDVKWRLAQKGIKPKEKAKPAPVIATATTKEAKP